MDDAGAVSCRQRKQELTSNIDSGLLRERATPCKLRCEAAAFEQLHDDVRFVNVGLSDVVHLDDV